MSVEMSHITKIYGLQKALDDISISITENGIVGLLGPNGAGKSTLMKILCGYINPTTGTAKVCGFDTSTNSLDIRKRIGYLPELNPLYEDMYIKEYLYFVGEIYRLDSLSQKVNSVLDRVRIGSESSKKIGNLSKGYKQRVGLAQALLPDPEILILDEPTTGLDPNQIEEIRTVLKEAGKNKTIILSTHIMQEAQAICERIILLDRGKIIADSPTADLLQNQKEHKCLYVEFDSPLSQAQELSLRGLSGFSEIKTHNAGWHLSSVQDNDLRPDLFKWAVEQELTIITLKVENESLESVFHLLTQQPS